MFPSQVTNEQIANHYDMKIEDSLYAVDSKGRRKFLTDLRVLLAREMTNKSKAEAKKLEIQAEKAVHKQQLKEAAQDLFVELDRTYQDLEVIMRNSQPGFNLKDLGVKIYCIASMSGKHIVSCTSSKYDSKFLEESFSNRKFYDKKDVKTSAITIPTNSYEDLVEVINRIIMIHNV